MFYKFIVDYISCDRQFTIDKGTIVVLIKVIKYKEQPSIAIVRCPLLDDKELCLPLLDLMFCSREYKGEQ